MSQETEMSAAESGEGTIEPEAAEGFASAFVPMWQLEDDESPKCTGTLPTPFDPFPRGTDVPPVVVAPFEADPFPTPRGDEIYESPGAPIGDPLTAEPVQRSPSLEPSTLESNEASTHVWEGREVVPLCSNRRLLMAVGGGAAIVVTLMLPFSPAKLPAQPARQGAAVEAPSLPERLSFPPPAPVSDLTPTSAEVPVASSAPAPMLATSTHELHARVLQPRSSSTGLRSPIASESASPSRSSKAPHGPSAGTAQLRSQPRSDRLPKKASDDLDGADAVDATCAGTYGCSGAFPSSGTENTAGTTCSTSARNACGGCSNAPGALGSACVGSDDCGGIYACAGLNVSCVECQSPGTCQESPGRCTDGLCAYPPRPDGSSCASGSRNACDVCVEGSCTGTLVCPGGGTCDPVGGCP
jgi:hypothetical protein